jgi:two-component system, NarL family, response regulator LiaR
MSRSVKGGRRPARPLRIRLLGDVPLVAAGLQAMLRPYDEHVVVLHDDGGTAVLADLLLHDPFLDRALAADPEARRCLGRSRPWVAWTWERHRFADADRFPVPPLAYLFKGADAEPLVADLVRISRGELRPSRVGTPGSRHDAVDRRSTLSDRQRDVLVRVSEGLSNAEIADDLCLSINTVKSYVRAAYDAIGVSTRPQAVLWAVEHGLRPPPPDDDALSAG